MADGLTYNPANADKIILPQFRFAFCICMDKDIDIHDIMMILMVKLTLKNAIV